MEKLPCVTVACDSTGETCRCALSEDGNVSMRQLEKHFGVERAAVWDEHVKDWVLPVTKGDEEFFGPFQGNATVKIKGHLKTKTLLQCEPLMIVAA